MPDPTTFDTFIRAGAAALRRKDRAPESLPNWEGRRQALRESMFAAMGSFPEKACDLEPRVVGKLARKGYRIENIIFQSRPGVLVTANAYVPEATGKVPAVLVVHGHWAGARRDPVVQARCLGLVKLGFFVLAVDAFSAGERHPKVALGAYHGALLGSALWPAGQTLLSLQVYDNRRAVDYLLSRQEVDGKRLGITGASGGGNQTMYAGALDERFGAVVPVCSVGTYQSYLHAACCVCEVLPGALRFTEEGDVLGLVAPRALMVINATKDSYQFSVGQAKKSLQRTRDIFKLYGKPEKVEHAVFESLHAYNQEMRERMYGWMTRWLKGEGEGKPIAEPKHDVEKPEDLACFPDGKRPAGFLFPPTFAAAEARRLLAHFDDRKLDHKEAWESKAVLMRGALAEVLAVPKKEKAPLKTGECTLTDGVLSAPFTLKPEPGLEVQGLVLQRPPGAKGKPVCLLLDLDGTDKALKHPIAEALLEKGWTICAVDLRATGEAQPAHDAIGGAPDHNSAEHALWIGRPLLGQWLVDVRAAADGRRLALVGIGQAGVVALAASALLAEDVSSIAVLDAPLSWITQAAYATGTRMGLLAPGILKVGDIPHLAALAAPRRLVVAGGVTSEGKKLDDAGLTKALAFTRKVYGLMKAEKMLQVGAAMKAAEVVDLL
jgi:dienelactone hydrolase